MHKAFYLCERLLKEHVISKIGRQYVGREDRVLERIGGDGTNGKTEEAAAT
jgi:hypothetical protein